MAANIEIRHTRYRRQQNGTGIDVDTNIPIICYSGSGDSGYDIQLPVSTISLSKGIGFGDTTKVDVASGDPEPSIGSTEGTTIDMSTMLNLADQTVQNPSGGTFNDRSILGFLYLMTRTKGLIRMTIDGFSSDDADLILLKSIPLIYNTGNDTEYNRTAPLPSGSPTVSSGTNHGPLWLRLTGIQMRQVPESTFVNVTMSWALDLSDTA